MALCGIDANILLDCDNPLIGGAESTLYLFNREDINFAGVTFDGTNRYLLTDFVLKMGQLGYKYEGLNRILAPSVESRNGDFNKAYGHLISFVVMANGAVVKEQVDKLHKGLVVAIVENKFKGGDSAFEVYGYHKGLETDVTREVNSTTNEGGYVLSLATNENEKEPDLPYSYFDTDYATTLAALQALIAP